MGPCLHKITRASCHIVFKWFKIPKKVNIYNRAVTRRKIEVLAMC